MTLNVGCATSWKWYRSLMTMDWWTKIVDLLKAWNALNAGPNYSPWWKRKGSTGENRTTLWCWDSAPGLKILSSLCCVPSGMWTARISLRRWFKKLSPKSCASSPRNTRKSGSNGWALLKTGAFLGRFGGGTNAPPIMPGSLKIKKVRNRVTGGWLPVLWRKPNRRRYPSLEGLTWRSLKTKTFWTLGFLPDYCLSPPSSGPTATRRILRLSSLTLFWKPEVISSFFGWPEWLCFLCYYVANCLSTPFICTLLSGMPKGARCPNQ